MSYGAIALVHAATAHQRVAAIQKSHRRLLPPGRTIDNLKLEEGTDAFWQVR